MLRILMLWIGERKVYQSLKLMLFWMTKMSANSTQKKQSQRVISFRKFSRKYRHWKIRKWKKNRPSRKTWFPPDHHQEDVASEEVVEVSSVEVGAIFCKTLNKNIGLIKLMKSLRRIWNQLVKKVITLKVSMLQSLWPLRILGVLPIRTSISMSCIKELHPLITILTLQ